MIQIFYALAKGLQERGLALEIVDTWLSSEFEGGRHKIRVNMIEE